MTDKEILINLSNLINRKKELIENELSPSEFQRDEYDTLCYTMNLIERLILLKEELLKDVEELFRQNWKYKDAVGMRSYTELQEVIDELTTVVPIPEIIKE